MLSALWGIASPARARASLRHVKSHLWTRFGVRTGGPGVNFGVKVSNLIANWISYFELEARLRWGTIAEVRSMLNTSWRYMHLDWKPFRGPQGNTQEPPSSTGWEHVTSSARMFRGRQSSLAHVWSEGATVIETTGLLGLTPISPGFSTWRRGHTRPGAG